MSVQVLLSTYNGVAYLPELLESLTRQDYPALSVLVRDDGSTDQTLDVVQRYATSERAIRVVEGAHLGFQRSFFELLRMADPHADHLALCDQDDVWLEDKVSRAVSLLTREPGRGPSLYCSRATLVDDELRPTGETAIPSRGLSFGNALVECPLNGCTMLLDQETRQLLDATPDHAYSHDWWIYLVVSALGRVVYDPEPRILYRRHTGNVFRLDTRTAPHLRTGFRRFLAEGGRRPVYLQATEFSHLFRDRLPERKRRELDAFLQAGRSGFLKRLAGAVSPGVYRQSRLDNSTLRFLLLLNRL